MAQHAWSAISIVYEGVRGVVSPLGVGDGTDGTAVGLAGFTSRRPFHYLDDDHVERVEHAASTFVVHPSIAGRQIGEDTLLVDAVPFNLPDVLSDLYTTSSMSGATEHRTTFDLPAFNAWLNDDNRSTYKFVDVPLTVGRHSDGTMLLERQDKSNARPQWTTRLRHEAFLTFQKFDLTGAPAEEEDPPFYHLVPSLNSRGPALHGSTNSLKCSPTCVG